MTDVLSAEFLALISELRHERDEWRQRAHDRGEEAEKWFRKRGEELEAREAAEARVKVLEDALENLVIAIGMGWDLDGVIGVARAALEEEKT